MNSISEALVREKLSDWTSSNKVKEVLELTSVEESLFKKEFGLLETKGIVERMGAKKGLKFRYKNSIVAENTIQKELKNDSKEEVSKHLDVVVSEKKSKKAKIAIEDIPCEIVILDKHEFTEEVTNVSINKLFTFITRNASEHSYTLSIKRTARGICVKTYRDIFMLSEVLYTKENFLLLLKASGISLE